mmetsp:Transcript_6129/g.15614  ORF Transcript_6129/g.15614 Transcript_6129/m.15614 type:complete len:207 (-) Transcript_6129:45-665(-)
MIFSTSMRASFRLMPMLLSTLAAMPVPSPMRPSMICSVPTKLWPRRRASSCASITTLIAFSVKRSNIAFVSKRRPRPVLRPADPRVCATVLLKDAARPLPSTSTAPARRKPLKLVMSAPDTAAMGAALRHTTRLPALRGPATVGLTAPREDAIANMIFVKAANDCCCPDERNLLVVGNDAVGSALCVALAALRQCVSGAGVDGCRD